MEITWLGHSCFRLRSGDNIAVTDPFPDSIGLSLGEPEAIAVTVSNQHSNHSNWQGVSGAPRVLSGPGEYEMSGIYVTGLMTPTASGDSPGERNTAYLFDMENLRLCHLGDVKAALTTRQVEELTPVDILFMPAGGTCTIEISQAVEIIRRLEPRVVIPMHYSVPGLNVELNGLEAFLKEMGIRELEPVSRLSITASNRPPEMRVVSFDPQGSKAELNT